MFPDECDPLAATLQSAPVTVLSNEDCKSRLNQPGNENYPYYDEVHICVWDEELMDEATCEVSGHGQRDPVKSQVSKLYV